MARYLQTDRSNQHGSSARTSVMSFSSKTSWSFSANRALRCNLTVAILPLLFTVILRGTTPDCPGGANGATAFIASGIECAGFGVLSKSPVSTSLLALLSSGSESTCCSRIFNDGISGRRDRARGLCMVCKEDANGPTEG